MKKIEKLVVIAVAIVSLFAIGANADMFQGTKIGGPAVIDDDLTGAIAIGNGWTNGYAHVKANGAMQIGPGSNTVANTMKFGATWVMLAATATSTVPTIDAAQITAGSSITAIDGDAITNLTPANVAAGTLPANVRINSTIVSNANGVGFFSNLTSSTTVTVPADSIAAASIAAGTLGDDVRINSTIVSNANGVGVFSNLTATTTVTVPSGSIAAASIASGTMGSGVRINSTIVSNDVGVGVFSNLTANGNTYLKGSTHSVVGQVTYSASITSSTNTQYQLYLVNIGGTNVLAIAP